MPSSVFTITATDIRNNAKHVASADVTDVQLEAILSREEFKVRMRTRRDTWKSTDRDFDIMQGIVLEMCTSKMLKILGDPLKQADKQMDDAKELLLEVATHGEDVKSRRVTVIG